MNKLTQLWNSNLLHRIVQDILLIIIMTQLVGIIGGYLFGFPFWNNVFDKWDYGFICGVALVLISQLKDVFCSYLESGEVG